MATFSAKKVLAEHRVRKLDPFRKFIEVAAKCGGEVINYTNIARDVGADVKTAQSYLELLEDTHIGFFLEPFHQSIGKRRRHAPKFFLFDTGVRRALDRTLTVELKPLTKSEADAFQAQSLHALPTSRSAWTSHPALHLGHYRT
jgi:uncharacterized protein